MPKPCASAVPDRCFPANLSQRPRVLVILIALALRPLDGMSAPPAIDDPAAAPAPASSTLEPVVVTAQKRREDIRQVPMAVTAISGETLNERQVQDITDLTRSVPNVSFSAQGGAGPGLGNLEIRGVSSAAGSSTVGVYLDEVSLTTRNLYSQGTAEPRFFDLDRVEVLRGPQGTLYGAGSLGGTVRYISRAPDLRRASAEVRTAISGTEHGGSNLLAEAVLNAPLTPDVSALRLGVQTGHDSGYIDQIDPITLGTVSRGINSTDWQVLKAALKVQAGGWTLSPAWFYQRTASADIDAAYSSIGGNQPGNPGLPLPRFTTSKIVREPGRDTLSLPSLTVTGDLGPVDFTGVASAYQRHFSRTQDGTYVNSVYVGSATTHADGTPNLIISNPAVANVVQFLPSAVLLDNRIDQTSLELRLASKTPDLSGLPFTWVVGLYLSDAKTDVTDSEPIFGLQQAFASAGVSIDDPAQWDPNSGFFVGAFPNDVSYFSNRHYQDRQHAVFGEINWFLSDHLRLLAGLRYVRATEDFQREGGDFFAGTPFSTVSIATSASKATPRIALNYDLDGQSTVYASASEGFRLGGANRPIPLTISGVTSDLAKLQLTSAPDSFQPDSLWSYEVGSKSRFLNNRVSLNLAAFYIDWKNIQQDIYLPSAGFDFETNVGNASSSGVEWELRARASDDLTLDLSGGIVRAVFADDVPALGVRKNDLVQGVPRFNVQAGADYRFHMASRDAFVRLTLQGVGSSRGSLNPGDPDYARNSYLTAAASWGINFGDWDLALQVRNLFNDRTVLQHPNIQSVNQSYSLRPRTIGLSLSGSL